MSKIQLAKVLQVLLKGSEGYSDQVMKHGNNNNIRDETITRFLI